MKNKIFILVAAVLLLLGARAEAFPTIYANGLTTAQNDAALIAYIAGLGFGGGGGPGGTFSGILTNTLLRVTNSANLSKFEVTTNAHVFVVDQFGTKLTVESNWFGFTTFLGTSFIVTNGQALLNGLPVLNNPGAFDPAGSASNALAIVTNLTAAPNSALVPTNRFLAAGVSPYDSSKQTNYPGLVDTTLTRSVQVPGGSNAKVVVDATSGVSLYDSTSAKQLGVTPGGVSLPAGPLTIGASSSLNLLNSSPAPATFNVSGVSTNEVQINYGATQVQFLSGGVGSGIVWNIENVFGGANSGISEDAAGDFNIYNNTSAQLIMNNVAGSIVIPNYPLLVTNYILAENITNLGEYWGAIGGATWPLGQNMFSGSFFGTMHFTFQDQMFLYENPGTTNSTPPYLGHVFFTNTAAGAVQYTLNGGTTNEWIGTNGFGGGSGGGSSVGLLQPVVVPVTGNYAQPASDALLAQSSNLFYQVSSATNIVFTVTNANAPDTFYVLISPAVGAGAPGSVTLTNGAGGTFVVNLTNNTTAYTNAITIPAWSGKLVGFTTKNSTNTLAIADIVTGNQRNAEFATNAASGNFTFAGNGGSLTNLNFSDGPNMTNYVDAAGNLWRSNTFNGSVQKMTTNGDTYLTNKFASSYENHVGGNQTNSGNIVSAMGISGATVSASGAVSGSSLIGNGAAISGTAVALSIYGTNVINSVNNNGVAPYTFKVGDQLVEGGGTNRPLTLPANPPAGTIFSYANTNANGSYYWTNTGSPTPTIGGLTAWSFGVGQTNASVVEYDGSNYVFLSMPNSGGSSGGGGGTPLKYFFAGLGSGGNVTLSLGATEFSFNMNGMHGASGVGGRMPLNTSLTFTNMQLVIDSSPQITNGQYLAIYPLTNGTRDTSWTWNLYGYNSNPFYTNTTAGTTYHYVPTGPTPMLSFVVSNMTAVNNCQFTLTLPAY